MSAARPEAAGGAARRDLAIIAVATVLVFAASAAFELNEIVLAWTRPWERYQLDELPGALLFVSVALAWFAWRRTRETRCELERRTQVERDLSDALAENRRLSLSHVQVQEDERRQLARELHDELGQHLNAIKIDAVSIRDWTRDRLPDAHAAAASVTASVDHVHGTVRDMLRRLRPAGLDELGLAAAVEELVQGWQRRHRGIRLTLEVDGTFEGLDEAGNITVFRLIQEGLNNVERHAAASQVVVRLRRGGAAEAADPVTLELEDDGVGSGTGRRAGGLGLDGMRERVEALGGQFSIDTRPGHGFRIRAVIPAGSVPP